MDSPQRYCAERSLRTNVLCFDILGALAYNTGIKEQYVQFRLWESTLKKLRRIYAETGESMIAIVDRLATKELERIEQAKRANVQVQAVSSQKE